VVVSLPASVLDPVGIKPGDRVLVEAAPPRRLIITKEGKTMTSTERLGLEIDLLEKRRQAIKSDQAYKLEQYNDDYFTEEGMSVDTFPLIMRELNRDLDRLTVEIAEKKLALYDLQGAEALNSRELRSESDEEPEPSSPPLPLSRPSKKLKATEPPQEPPAPSPEVAGSPTAEAVMKLAKRGSGVSTGPGRPIRR